jgi:8-oxo-dGTP pyrophosphatase MutT (NUDIX family)
MNKISAGSNGSSIIFETPFWKVRVLEDTDGTCHYFIDTNDSVCIVPQIVEDRYMLVQIARPAHGQSFLEWPGGGIELGESPDQAAYRELHEETGVKANSLTFLGAIAPLNGLTMERCHVFTTTIPAPTRVSETLQHIRAPENGEVESLVAIPKAQVTSAILENGGDAVALAAWLLSERHGIASV